jgi:hypothetical protein
MTFTSAKYTNDSITGQLSGVSAVLEGETLQVPLDPANRHYAEIMRQVAAGTLTIADAD